MSRQSTGIANEAVTIADRVVTIAAGTTQLLSEKHANRLLEIGQAAAAVTLNLPYATGSGDIYEFLSTVARTSGSLIINARHPGTATNSFVGTVKNYGSGGVVLMFSSTTNDIITLNITTTGGQKAGDYIKLQDVAPQVWRVVDGSLFSSGAHATPFSG